MVKKYWLLFRQIYLIEKNLWNLVKIKANFEQMEEIIIGQVKAMVELRKKVG